MSIYETGKIPCHECGTMNDFPTTGHSVICSRCKTRLEPHFPILGSCVRPAPIRAIEEDGGENRDYFN